MNPPNSKPIRIGLLLAGVKEWQVHPDTFWINADDNENFHAAMVVQCELKTAGKKLEWPNHSEERLT